GARRAATVSPAPCAAARAIRASSTRFDWPRSASIRRPRRPPTQARKEANEAGRSDPRVLHPHARLGRLPVAEALVLPAPCDPRDRVAVARAAAAFGDALRRR